MALLVIIAESSVASAPTITCVDCPAGENRRFSARAWLIRSPIRPMAVSMVAPLFSGASRARLASVGSSRLIESLSAKRPASSTSHGLASGIDFR
ncbi:hypothetical protein MMMDOFMJ_4068 [Methylobacterium gnaphalii]|nr:hypothetical protein MMMDOFMJ_4068 [Methylobacterium gnaphalii]